MATDSDCPACGGLGWQRMQVPPGHPKFGQLVLCELCGSKKRQEWLERVSRLSPEMLKWHLGQFQDRGKLSSAYKKIRGAAHGVGWLTLSGPPGVGKTYILAAIANDARMDGRVAVYLTVADLLADLRECFNPQAGVGFSTLFQSVMDADVLCLDEIEKFRATPWAEEQFFRLVEHRYRNWNQGLTVLATNRPIKLNRPILEETTYPGYLESRIKDGRFVVADEFWSVTDARPALKNECAA